MFENGDLQVKHICLILNNTSSEQMDQLYTLTNQGIYKMRVIILYEDFEMASSKMESAETSKRDSNENQEANVPHYLRILST